MTKQTSSENVQFIFSNKEKMRQADIARHLKICPSTVNQILKGKRRYHENNDEYFNVDQFAAFYKF